MIESLLCKLFPYVDIHRAGTDDIYLRRWFLYPRDKDLSKNKGKGRLYLHKFYRGDEDPHLHDHPWPFTSLILTRGYWEETSDADGLNGKGFDKMYSLGADGEERIQQFYPRFSLLRRPATWRHRVILDGTEPVWTLVRTGVKQRSWGFWVRGKLCPWRQYDNGVCWCEDEQQQQQQKEAA